jgi:hypothetical protein
MDVLGQPHADRGDVAGAQRLVLRAEVLLEALPELGGDQAAERVAGEVAERARRPVRVLERA